MRRLFAGGVKAILRQNNFLLLGPRRRVESDRQIRKMAVRCALGLNETKSYLFASPDGL